MSGAGMNWIQRRWYYRERRCSWRWCIRRRSWISGIYCKRHAAEWFERELGQAAGPVSTDPAIAGTCRTCGRDLVHVPGERTYHPAVVLQESGPCPALLPIRDTEYLSHDVPYTEFILVTSPDDDR
ncbi:MAG TPA: hypothetical protein VIQ30_17905 [Pseudonocardia sp.]